MWAQASLVSRLSPRKAGGGGESLGTRLGANLSELLTNPTMRKHSLIPRPIPFFVLRFAFNIIHGGGRARKTGKAWEHLSRA